MKKLNVILLILSFILSGIGSMFLFDAKTATNDSIQTVAPSNKIESEEITEYTYKTYEDYFVDYFNLPAETYTRDETTKVVTIDYSNIKRTTANGETELSYNGNVFYTITSNDLTGTGSQTDPYVVYSTNGFLFITNSYISNKILISKYVKLAGDIILNDETFDENGNPSGGDGKYYNWKISSTTRDMHFDGAGYIITGLYGVATEEDSDEYFERTLFGFHFIAEIKNTTLSNVFIDGVNKRQTASFANITRKITNCILKSGNVKGAREIGGLVGTTYTMTKCDNYANIYSSYQTLGGLACYSYGNIDNCNNYGNIFVQSNVDNMARVGGIIYISVEDRKIINCNNYGNIKTNNLTQIAGIVSWGKGEVINCNNYGDISGRNVVGGIVAYVAINNNLSIFGCNNYGKISTSEMYSVGQIFGQTADQNKNKQQIIIKDCYSRCLSNRGLMGRGLDNVDIKIENCKLEYIDHGNQIYGMLFYSILSTSHIEVNNIEVTVNKEAVVRLYGSLPDKEDSCIIKNVLIDIKDSKSTFRLYYVNIGKPIIEGVIIKNSIYYGSNFSGFYVSWRTGKIGLVALDGRGSFQGKIDEEWLLNKGYLKKEI